MLCWPLFLQGERVDVAIAAGVGTNLE